MFSSISGQKRKVILKPKPFKPLFFRLYVSCLFVHQLYQQYIPVSLLLCVDRFWSPFSRTTVFKLSLSPKKKDV